MAASRFVEFVDRIETCEDVAVGLVHRTVPTVGRFLSVSLEFLSTPLASYPAPEGSAERAAELLLTPSSLPRSLEERPPTQAFGLEARRRGFDVLVTDAVILVHHRRCGVFARHPAAGCDTDVAARHLHRYLHAVGWFDGAFLRGCATCGREVALREFRGSGGADASLLPSCCACRAAPRVEGHSATHSTPEVPDGGSE